ncbi:MAG: phosphatase PAP2 family protein [Acidobacteria bacterium]|nr:phosphatase PAP2 family protein [Acidobacteriota bacterium]
MIILLIFLVQTSSPMVSNDVHEDFRNRASESGLSFKFSDPFRPETDESAIQSTELSFGSMLWQDSKEVFSTPLRWNRRNWQEMGYLIASFAAVNQFDDQVTQFARNHNNSAINTVSIEFAKFGEEYSFATLAAFYLAGKVFRDEKPVNVAKDGLIASLLAAGIVTPLIKEASGRVRPRDEWAGLPADVNFQPFSGNHSFPSGHTTQAFAVASVISEHYPNVWARSISFGLASLVGLSRVQGDAHYASDVAAGAAIGFFIGRKVVRINLGKRDRITIDPMVQEGYLGIRVRVPQDRHSLRGLFRRD